MSKNGSPSSTAISEWSRAAVRLLQGVVYGDEQRTWDQLLASRTPLENYFSRLGLLLVVDESEGFAYLRQMNDEDYPEGVEPLPKLFRRAPLGYGTTLLCVLACAGLVLGAITLTSAKEKAEKQVFSGSYDWKQGGSDELSAEFKPDGENRWKVTFRFRWNKSNNTWKGKAEGSLEDGSTLTGTATSGSRNWIWEASIEDGVMRGSHREIHGSDKRYDTGTFELTR